MKQTLRMVTIKELNKNKFDLRLILIIVAK